MSTKPKRICSVCQTTKFKKTSDSGLVCKYGHKVLGVQDEEAEDAFGIKGFQRKAVANLEIDNIESSPAQQKSDFTLVIQYTLQVLAKSLVEDLHFPPEFEATLRELWLLYISDSKTQLAEGYLFEALEMEKMDKQTGKDKQDIFEKIEEVAIEEFLDEDDFSDDDTEPQRIGSSRRPWPKLSFPSCLSFIYLACIYLHYPILPNDLVRWSQSGEIPYLSMQQRIPPELLSSFSLKLSNTMRHVPLPGSIKLTAFKLSNCYLVNCKLAFPEFNIPLYLDRFCGQYYLPTEGYFFAKSIFESYRTRHLLDLCVQNRRRDQLPAIALLMACVVATVKIFYAIGDNRLETLLGHSAFDKTFTKEAYLKHIKENVARWKNVNNQQEELDSIIQYIQKTSVASRISASVGDKHVLLLNETDKGDKIHKTNKRKMYTPFMDAMEWKEGENNEEMAEIGLGQLYYRQVSGEAKHDYLDILELATLVTGEVTGDDMKVAIQKIDTDIIRNNQIFFVKRSEHKELFK